MKADVQEQHRWLQRLVGEWIGEPETSDDPATPQHPAWTETVRAIGDVWIQGEGRATMEDGTPSTSLITLGYDPVQGRFVGTWVGTMMTHLWIYSGELDASGEALSLECEGPSFTDDGGTSLYRDIISFESPDHRVLTSTVQKPDGTWEEFMRLHYRRKP